MRSIQVFAVFPSDNAERIIVIQSDTRIGEIDLETGHSRISAFVAGGASIEHLALVEKPNAIIFSDDLSRIRDAVLQAKEFPLPVKPR